MVDWLAGLVVLAAVADARSFGKAAERLGMTQSGVSKAIAKLESRLGARLIHRTSRAVELTDEGRALYERVVRAPRRASAKRRRRRRNRETRCAAGCGSMSIRCSRAWSCRRSSASSSCRTRKWSFASKPGTASADLVSDGFDLAVRFGEPTPSALIARRILDAAHSYRCLADLHRSARKTRSSARLGERRHQCIRAIDTSTGRPFDWEFRRGKELISVAVNGRLTVTDFRNQARRMLGRVRRGTGHRPRARASS